MGPGYEDTLRRTSSYRILKSQPSETPIAPRYIERASASDANVYSAPPPSSASVYSGPSVSDASGYSVPLSIATQPAEPVAFLTMDLEIAKASHVFVETLGIPGLKGRKLFEIVIPSEREKVHSHQRQLLEEQSRKEPNYLPPIFGKEEEEKVIQSLGFGTDELSRFQLDRQDYLTFNSVDGPRALPVRMGLAKEGSIYFVVLLLILPPPYPYPSPSPHGRDVPYSYQPPPPASRQQQTFTQHTPVSATFDPGRQRFGESALGPRQVQAPPSAQMIAGLSPGISPGIPSYSPSPSRPDYPVGPTGYQVPRSELPPGTRPAQQPTFQLPPIRAQPQPGAPPTDPYSRDDRSNRVDIGGLIDKPDQSRRSR
jgi:hypothetical protein